MSAEHAVPDLPPPHTPGRYVVAVVCLGNICRSPMAHVVLEAGLVEAGLDDRVEVTSSGTGGWHVGNPMDRRASATLTAAGYDASRHRAQQYDAAAAGRAGTPYDVVLVMDDANLADVGGRSERVMKFRDWDPLERGADVPDPYYGGDDGFTDVLAMVERTSDEIVAAIARVVR